MSWGIRITLLYLGFVAIIVTLVIISYGHPSDLESKDYYVRELKFQDRINAEANANALSTPINYNVEENGVDLVIPKEIVCANTVGSVRFMRPSNALLDTSINLSLTADGSQHIQPGGRKGVYKMEIELTCDGKNYYKEAVVNFR